MVVLGILERESIKPLIAKIAILLTVFYSLKQVANVQGECKEGDYFYCTNITENIIIRRSKLFIAFFSLTQQMILVKEDALITSAGCANLTHS